MFLDVADANMLPLGWSRYAQFSLAVVNQLDSRLSMRKGIPFISHLSNYVSACPNITMFSVMFLRNITC
jgi:hypothetical protein